MGDFLASFADVACEFEFVWQMIFSLTVILSVVLGFSFLIVPPGSASYYVSLVTVLFAVPLTVASGAMVRFCA